jgi:cytochrome P450
VIGRGEPATTATDASTDRLLDRCGQLPAGGVPTVSLLYQNFDATAALIATTLMAVATHRPAVAAVPRTRRTATRDVVVAGSVLPVGSDVVVEIGAAGLPFGAGPHQCPGRG